MQLLYRNDTEADCPAQTVIEWDRRIVVDEAHMPSDRPGLIMRRRLLELLREHGEDEVRRGTVLA